MRSRLIVALSLSVALALTGCQSNHVASLVPTAGTALRGNVHGGQQPVAGAKIQLYAVGTAGDGSAATPLISATVTTSDGTGNAANPNANAGNSFNSLPVGDFTITGDYTCPTAASEVYLTAVGGNPGLASGTNNAALTMFAALGQCGNLSSSTSVFIDEVTTVGSVAALYPYMTSYAALGSGSGDASEFMSAFATVNEYTNTATGSAPGPSLPAGYYASSTEINTLSDILAPCINSAGGVSGDGSACGTLFQLTKPASGPAPTDTIGALLQILKNPAINVAAIFNLGFSNAPFQPELAAAPTDWTLPILPIPAAPAFSLGGGTYSGTQTVTLSDSTPGAVIYYTTNGTTPTASSTLYSGAITVSASETLKAIAIEDTRVSSAVSTAAYTIVSSTTPVIASVSAIVAQQTQTITITGLGFGSLAPYTGTNNYIFMHDVTNGDWSAGYSGVGDTVGFSVTSWTNTQIVITGFTGSYGGGNLLRTGDQLTFQIWNAPTVNGPATCSNIVVGGGATNCGANLQAATPVFSPAAGTYTSAQSVTISTATPGASIYYTLDGSTPTTSSTLYSSAITVTSSETINAIAVAAGYTNSAVGSAAYVINTYGIITTIAGTGTAGYGGDGGVATSAYINSPYGVTVDTYGNMYIADYGNSRIRKVTPAGVITTFAGNGTGGFAGDGGLATSAEFNGPIDVAADNNGNVYVADFYNQRVRKINSAGIISTIAGTGTGGYNGEGTATSAQLNYPAGLAVDTSGNVYIAEYFGSRVRKVTPAGVISTVAGTGSPGYSGDGGAATSAQLYYDNGIAVDAAGNLYIGDGDNRVRKVNTSGIISTIAGNGTAGYTGDGGPATSAELTGTEGIAVDNGGNIYIGNGGAVRKVNAAGIITTAAGTGTQGYSGDGGPATLAKIHDSNGLAVDAYGNLYIADGGNARVRLVTYGATQQTAAAPTVSVAPGTYTSAQSVYLTSATSGASLYYTTDGTTPTTGSTLFTGAITVASTETIKAIAVASGYANSPVASYTYTIALPAAAPTFSPAAGTYTSAQSVTISSTTTGASIYYTLDGSTPSTSSNHYTSAIAVSVSETIKAIAAATGYSSSPVSSAAYTILLPAATPAFTVPGGSYSGIQPVTIASTTPSASIYYTTDGSTPTTSSLLYSSPVLVSTNETINAIAVAAGYSASPVGTASYTITDYGIMSTYAGTGVSGYSGDGGQATSAQLQSPQPVAVDSNGNVYAADYVGNRVRKITPAGVITTFAGNGTASSTGDGGQAASATVNGPNGIAVDASGNVYIGEEHGSRVRKVTPAGVISTVAGTGVQGYNGDGGPATSAQLTDPEGVAVDASGNLYIGDAYANRVRKVTPAGIISTFAGTGTAGYNGDNIAATSATLYTPYSIATDSAGNVYISDTNNERIRKVNAAGVITTIAGTGAAGYAGDGGAATSAKINGAIQIAVDNDGNVYIADQGNYRVRKVTAAGIMSTIAGNGTAGYTGNGGLATLAEIKSPQGVAVDASGNVYIGDPQNSAVRKVTYQATLGAAATPTFSLAAGTYVGTQSVTLSDTTAGVSIYYTVNGSTPTTSSTLYTGAISVTASETINAIAAGNGYSASAVATAAYTINPYVTATSLTATPATVNVGSTVVLKATVASAAPGGVDNAPVTFYDGSNLIGSITSSGGVASLSTSTLVAGTHFITATYAGDAYFLSSNSIAAMVTVNKLSSAVGGSPSLTSIGYGTQVTLNAAVSPSAATGTISFIVQGATLATVNIVNGSASYTTSGLPLGTDSINLQYSGDATYNGSVGSGGTVTVMSYTATPQISPLGGTFSAPQTVTMNSSTGGAAIYYTTNGTTPTAASTLYIGSITVSTSETIEAIAFASGDLPSSVATASFTILLTAATPTFSPGTGTYTATEPVTIASTTSGAKIYYTTDGTTPTASSNLYSGPVSVGGAGTLKAIAVASGYSNSAVGSAVYTINPYGVISTFAGTGAYGYNGDNIQATTAKLYSPSSVVFDSNGNAYLADQSNFRVRRVTPAGVISTFAGNGTQGDTGDNGPATSAEIGTIAQLAIDSANNIYIADDGYNVVRKVSASGTITTVAGNGKLGYTGDNGPATSAELNGPGGVAVDSNGNLYIADTSNQRVRMVSPAGIITTVAGTGLFGYNGDGIQATTAELYYPTNLAVDTFNNLYIVEIYNRRIRKVTPAGIISTIAGNGTQTDSGDGGSASTSGLRSPNGVVVDSGGVVYITDYETLRRVTPDGIINTIAGNINNTYSGDGGPAALATLDNPLGVAVDSSNNLYIADEGNERIRKITFQAAPIPAATPVISVASGTYTTIQSVTITDTQSGTSIYYTLDGSTPTASSTLYTGAISVGVSETLNAIAVAPSYGNSAVATATYTINLPTAPTPTFSLAAGTYTSIQSLTMSDSLSGALIYYTLDGSTPTTNSSLYFQAVPITGNETVKAIAVKTGYLNSAVDSAAYVVNVTTSAPFFTPVAGSYQGSVTVTIASSTAGATFYYTLDGSTPTIHSTLYTGPFTLTSTTTVNAIAVGYTTSTVTTGVYTITAGVNYINFSKGFPAGSLVINLGSGNTLPAIVNNTLQFASITTGGYGSSYFPTKVPVDNFDTSFEFTDTDATADGFTLLFQNQSLSALGGPGISLGSGPGGPGVYSNGIPASVALKFDLFNNSGEGTDSTGVYLNGAYPSVPAIDMTSSGVILNSGHLLHAHVTYDGTNMVLTLLDTVTGAVFTHTFAVNIPSTVGATTAWVGFGSSTGSYVSNQVMSSWVYSSSH